MGPAVGGKRTRFFPARELGGLVGILFLAVMVAWPLAAIGVRSFAGIGVDRLFEILTRPATLRTLGFTVTQAMISTAVTFVVGLPIAHVLARFSFRGRRLLRATVLVPFVLPTVVVAASFRSLFDGLAPGDGVPPLAAVVAAHVFFNVAVVVRVVGGHWSTLSTEFDEAARMLGVNGLLRFRRVTLPLLAPVLLTAGVVVFLFCFTSYGIILILGGPRMATLETEIQRYAVFRGELDVAGSLALLQMVVVASLAIAAARIGRRRRTGSLSARASRPATGRVARLWLASVWVVTTGVVLAPIASLVEQSLRTGGGFGLDHYRALSRDNPQLPVSALEALVHSLVFGVVAAAVAAVVGTATARSAAAGGRIGRVAAGLSVLPLGVSAVTLGFGYLLAFRSFDLRRSVWLLPLSHAVIGLPFVLATLRPAMAGVDARLRQVAATLGASPREVWWRVEWPLIRRAVVTGAGFAAAVSIGEFGATTFLSRGEAGFTAPLAVFRLLARPGAELRGQALALSVVIGLVVALLSLGVDALDSDAAGRSGGRGR